MSKAITQQLRVAGASRVHIFMAAPNAFSFFFGQHQKAVGPVTLYEWDFDGLRGGGYNESLSVGS
jgi:SMODS-associated and fused to various effectors sensor domain